MDLLTRPQGISFPLAPVMAGAIGFGIAIIVGTLPAPLFEGLVMASGLPAVLAAAEPPLGLTARVLVIVSLGLLIAAMAQVPLSYVYGRRRLRVKTPRVARATVHYIKPSRVEPPAKPRPIAAHQELGAPFLSVTREMPQGEPLLPKPAEELKPAPKAKRGKQQHQRVTDMVELAEGIYIPDRRLRPRDVRRDDPVFSAEPTVANLLKRLEIAVATDQLGPLGRRPLDPAFREAVESLSGFRRAG